MSATEVALRHLIRNVATLAIASQRLGIPEAVAVDDLAGPQADDLVAAFLEAAGKEFRREASASLARVDQLLADVDARYAEATKDPVVAAALARAPRLVELEELRTALRGPSS